MWCVIVNDRNAPECDRKARLYVENHALQLKEPFSTRWEL
jgi:hypothetical protein